MAHSRFIERAVTPLAVLIQVTPIIAYAPAVVIWLGFGLKPILVITSLVCFVPFLINGVTGLRSVDSNLLELARSVDASRREVFWKLRFPSALPHLFSAARIAVGLALIGAVLGEFFAGVQSGLGYSIKFAQSRFLTMQLWGSVYVLALIGSIGILLINGLERLTLHWHSSQRTEVRAMRTRSPQQGNNPSTSTPTTRQGTTQMRQREQAHQRGGRSVRHARARCLGMR